MAEGRGAFVQWQRAGGASSCAAALPLRRSCRRWAGLCPRPPINGEEGRGLSQSPPMRGGGGVARAGSGGAALGAGRGRRSPPPPVAAGPGLAMAAPPRLGIQMLLEAAEFLERRERGTPRPPSVFPVPPAGPRGDPRPPLCLRRSRARLRLAAARREGRGGPAAPRQGPEERRRRQVTAAPGGAGGPDRRGLAVVELWVPLPTPCGRARCSPAVTGRG